MSAENERRIESQVGLFKVSLVATLDVSHGVRNETGHVEHRTSGPQVGRPLLRISPLPEHVDDRLRSRKVSGAEQDEHAIARSLEDRHLGERGEVVDRGMGARVRREDDSVVEKNADTISHADSLVVAFTTFDRHRVPPGRTSGA
jgi:hypothetical protein